MLSLLIRLEIKYSITTVKSEPSAEDIGKNIVGKNTIDIAVNRVVPLAIPKVYGVIRAFLNMI